MIWPAIRIDIFMKKRRKQKINKASKYGAARLLRGRVREGKGIRRRRMQRRRRRKRRRR